MALTVAGGSLRSRGGALGALRDLRALGALGALRLVSARGSQVQRSTRRWPKLAAQGEKVWPFCKPAGEAEGGRTLGLANSMGLFLQKTNIIRDYLEV